MELQTFTNALKAASPSLSTLLAPYTGEQPDSRIVGKFDNRPYTGGMYRTEKLQEYAKWFIKHMAHFGPVDFVAVTGKSGMSVAFAALAMQEFNLVTVRKGESSHGWPVEGIAPEFGRYVILDDFVSSGATVGRIQEALHNEAHRHGWRAPELIGCLMYRQSWSGGIDIDGRQVPTFGSGEERW